MIVVTFKRSSTMLELIQDRWKIAVPEVQEITLPNTEAGFQLTYAMLRVNSLHGTEGIIAEYRSLPPHRFSEAHAGSAWFIGPDAVELADHDEFPFSDITVEFREENG